MRRNNWRSFRRLIVARKWRKSHRRIIRNCFLYQTAWNAFSFRDLHWFLLSRLSDLNIMFMMWFFSVSNLMQLRVMEDDGKPLWCNRRRQTSISSHPVGADKRERHKLNKFLKILFSMSSANFLECHNFLSLICSQAFHTEIVVFFCVTEKSDQQSNFASSSLPLLSHTSSSPSLFSSLIVFFGLISCTAPACCIFFLSTSNIRMRSGVKALGNNWCKFIIIGHYTNDFKVSNFLRLGVVNSFFFYWRPQEEETVRLTAVNYTNFFFYFLCSNDLKFRLLSCSSSNGYLISLFLECECQLEKKRKKKYPLSSPAQINTINHRERTSSLVQRLSKSFSL